MPIHDCHCLSGDTDCTPHRQPNVHAYGSTVQTSKHRNRHWVVTDMSTRGIASVGSACLTTATSPPPPSYDAAGASFSILAGVRSVHMVHGPLNPLPFTFHHTADEFPMSVRFDAEHPLLPGLRRGLGTSFTRQGAGARFALQWRRFQRLVFLNHVLYNILNMNAYVYPTERKEFGRKVSSRVRIVHSRRVDEVRPSRY